MSLPQSTGRRRYISRWFCFITYIFIRMNLNITHFETIHSVITGLKSACNLETFHAYHQIKMIV